MNVDVKSLNGSNIKIGWSLKHVPLWRYDPCHNDAALYRPPVSLLKELPFNKHKDKQIHHLLANMAAE